jgi:death-on-curing protein
VEALRAIHEELISRYGGASGVRSAGLLESAVARAQHLAAYKRNLTVPALAAAYGWGLLRNHPFVDGNKRIALAAVVVFLDLNGWELTCSEAEETAMVLRAAAGEMSERAWSDWVRRSARKKP